MATKTKQNVGTVVDGAMEKGKGVLRLAPNWVPRNFLVPGRRLKLHPDDYYAMGMNRGGIDERWFGSTTPADNGPLTAPNEGLSFIAHGRQRVLLRDAINRRGEEILGRKLWKKWGAWKVYAKFFDNLGPIPHHLHHLDKHAKLVGQEGKPESYYFPPQLNNTGNHFPYTFFGLQPGTTKADLKRCLQCWHERDNGILYLSQAYKLEPGTGWLLPGGILHAPGSLLTYEVQWASDVFALFQNVVEERFIDWNLLVQNVPKNKRKDLDFIVGLVDWQANLDPEFVNKYHIKPVHARGGKKEGFHENWIIYGRIKRKDLFSAKELTVHGGATVTLTDGGPYCALLIQGHGRINGLRVSTPAMIRYGEMTQDELFVSAPAAAEGVTIENLGAEPLVLLKYFGPDSSPDQP